MNLLKRRRKLPKKSRSTTMLKKLGGFLIIVLLGLIIWAVCNMEGFSKKYVYPIG